MYMSKRTIYNNFSQWAYHNVGSPTDVQSWVSCEGCVKYQNPISVKYMSKRTIYTWAILPLWASFVSAVELRPIILITAIGTLKQYQRHKIFKIETKVGNCFWDKDEASASKKRPWWCKRGQCIWDKELRSKHLGQRAGLVWVITNISHHQNDRRQELTSPTNDSSMGKESQLEWSFMGRKSLVSTISGKRIAWQPKRFERSTQQNSLRAKQPRWGGEKRWQRLGPTGNIASRQTNGKGA